MSNNESEAATDQSKPSGNGEQNKDNNSDQQAAAKPTQSPAKQPDEKADIPQAPSRQTKASDTGPGSGRWVLPAIFLLVLLGSLAAGGWWSYGYVTRYVEDRLDSAQQSNTREIQRLAAQLEQERQARATDFAGLQQAGDEIRNRVNSQSRRLRELSGTTRSDWLLAEAEYLIRLGIQRFITERNTANSIALMESADQILAELDEVDLLPVRRTLARDITTLRMIDNIDREGLYLQLDAIAEAIKGLPLIPLQPEVKEDPAPESTDQDQNPGWREQFVSNIRQSLARLTNLVRVQRRSAEMQPLLSVEEEPYIKQNLRFMVEQAQVALLREEQLVYRQSLEKAAGWIRDYFQLNTQSQRLVTELETLAQTDIQTDYPDISGGLEALRSFIDNWHSRYTVPANGETANTGVSQPTGSASRPEEPQ